MTGEEFHARKALPTDLGISPREKKSNNKAYFQRFRANPAFVRVNNNKAPALTKVP